MDITFAVFDPAPGCTAFTVADHVHPQPSLLHEEEGSLRRKRADLTVSLRVREETQAPSRGSITSASAAVFHKNNNEL